MQEQNTEELIDRPAMRVTDTEVVEKILELGKRGAEYCARGAVGGVERAETFKFMLLQEWQKQFYDGTVI